MIFKLLKYTYIAGLVLFIVSCSGYERVLKSTDYEMKYKKAMEYYEKEKYTKAYAVFEQLIPVLRATQKADTVNYLFAYCNYYQGDYLLAANYFKNFVTVYGNSPFAEEAEYMTGYCYYLSSPRAELDQQDTYTALQELKLFLIRHPKSDKRDDCLKFITVLEDKLVEKSYLSSRLYFDLEKYKAALVSLSNSLSEYPNSKYREELMFLLVKANYLYAFNSVSVKKNERFQNTVDEYYSFIAEFPESKYRKEADKIFSASARFLKLETNEELKLKRDERIDTKSKM